MSDMQHPAEKLNNIKDHCLSVYHKYDLDKALKTLNSYRDVLPLTAWIGLKAELIFYSQFFQEYCLDPANDHGTKADFIGDIDGKRYRIDVTTNIEFKKLEQFEPLINKFNRKYKIAVMNPKTFEFEGFFDLNFPYDASGNGRLFDAAIFMPATYNCHGECRYDYYQKIITIGTSNPQDDCTEQGICTDWYLPDIETFLNELDHENKSLNINSELNRYLSSSAKVLSKSTGRQIVACGCCVRDDSNPKDGEGEFIGTRLVWVDPVVAKYLPKLYIEKDLSDQA